VALELQAPPRRCGVPSQASPNFQCSCLAAAFGHLDFTLSHYTQQWGGVWWSPGPCHGRMGQPWCSKLGPGGRGGAWEAVHGPHFQVTAWKLPPHRLAPHLSHPTQQPCLIWHATSQVQGACGGLCVQSGAAWAPRRPRGQAWLDLLGSCMAAATLARDQPQRHTMGSSCA
jgi:hypothetical protein